MPRPVHFEIPADNPERAIAFYQAVFGWTFQKWEGGNVEYWMIITGPDGEPGINGGLMPRQHPDQPCVNTIGVANLDETLAAVEKNGGKCVLPKMPIPTVGWLAYCKDTEGHIFGLMQPDANAR
jgi:predicted enzyme related to lactoylglutathione lyase